MPPTRKRPYRRIGRFLAEFRSQLAGAFAVTLLASAAFALLPWPVRYLIDGVLVNDEVRIRPFGTFATATTGDKLRFGAAMAIAYFVIQLLAAVLASAGFYLFAKAALEMIHTLRGRMLTHLRRLSLGYHADRSSGELIFRSINDARSIQEVVILGFQAWVLPMFQIALMVALMAALDWRLTLAGVAVSPILVWTIKRLTVRIQGSAEESRAHLAKLTSLVEQTMGAIRAVQVFGRDSSEEDRFEGTSRAFIAAQLRFRMAEQGLSVATMTLTGLGTAAVLWVATHRVVDGALTVGALWIFVSYLQRIYELLQRNLALYGMFQDAVVGAGRAFAVLDTEPDIVDAAGAQPLAGVGSGIALRDVRLTYDRDEVLRGVNLDVPAGSTVALVGETGSGKTSVLNLVPRLYDVTGGAVTVAGVDIRDATLASLRDLVSLVPQEPLLFSTTIGENIRYGRLAASDDEVEAAAKAARAHEFISQLPDGYRTEVGDRGVKLSVGQQQRIALARAFLKDAPILLLDEPTSALDLRTEADLLDGLADLMAGRTVLIVAHRLSTIRHADRIHVLDHGQVIESGDHDDLLAAGGAYARLWSTATATAARSAVQ